MAALDPEQLFAELQPNSLKALYDWDPVAFVLSIEQELGCGIKVDPSELPTLFGERFFWWIKKPAPSIGAWCRDTAQLIYDRLENNEPSYQRTREAAPDSSA